MNITGIVTAYEGAGTLRSAHQTAKARIGNARHMTIPVSNVGTIPYMGKGGAVCTANDRAYTNYINKGGCICTGVFIFTVGNMTSYQTTFDTEIRNIGTVCFHEEAGTHAADVIDKQIGYGM